ncbi:MAG: diadenosine tetraphosphate hydrolase [Planctomycetes bacterium]|nr:diadenosine tetraphosphate hydrolase [Planctomycetota bacterium]
MIDDRCSVCAAHEPSPCLVAWESPRWILRHHPGPAPLCGWFLLCSRRHVASVADLNPVEEREFARILGACMRALRDTRRVPRVYVVMFGEGAPHLHAHLIPRDASCEATRAWAVADFYRAVERRERAPAAPDAVDAIIASMRARLAGELDCLTHA